MQVNVTRRSFVPWALVGLVFIIVLGLLLVWIQSRSEPTTALYNAQNMAAVLPAPMQTVQPTITVMEPTLTVRPQVSPYPSVTPLSPEIVLERDYGAWNFKMLRDPAKGEAALVRYDDKSLTGIQSYAAANKALAKELAEEGKEVPLYITFREFVEPETFRTWATARGLHVTDVDLRIIDGMGNPAALFVSARGGDPLPQDSLDNALRPRSQVGGGSGTIVGAYYVRATVDAINLPSIAGDPLVFLADVTSIEVRKELAASGLTRVEDLFVNVQPPHPFFKMEEIGLDKFKP